MVETFKCPRCRQTKILFTKKERREQALLARKIVLGFKEDEANKQLIEDYWYCREKSLGFLFGRIMNMLIKEMPKNKLRLYVVIRNRISLEHLDTLLSNDWVGSSNIRMCRLIKIAKKWEKEK